MPNETRGARQGIGRLQGLRCVHTHLRGEDLTQDDLTDLALLRLDLMAAIDVDPETALPGLVRAAHLLPMPAGDLLEERDQRGLQIRIHRDAHAFLAPSVLPAPTFFQAYYQWMQSPMPSWSDVAWLRQQWDGPFMLKGVIRVARA